MPYYWVGYSYCGRGPTWYNKYMPKKRVNKEVRLYVFAAVSAVFILVLVSGYAYEMSRRSKEIRSKTEGITQLIHSLQTIKQNVTDAETGQRGFLLTNDQRYLSPYQAVYQTILNQDLVRVKQQLQGVGAYDSVGWSTLSTLIADKLDELRQTIDLSTNQGQAKALAVVNTNRGQELMEGIRQRLDTLIAEQSQSADLNSKIVQEQDIRTAEITIFGDLLAGVIVVGALISGGLELSRRAILESVQRDRQRELENLNRYISEERLRDEAILLSISDGLLATDRHGLVTMVNPAAERMLGFSATKMIGTRPGSYTHCEDENGNQISLEDMPLSRALATGKPTQAYIIYVTPKGVKSAMAIKITPIIRHGKLTGTIATMRDRSSECAIEKSKTEFISLASHELRTPLAAISLFSELLEEDVTHYTAKQKGYVRYIRQEIVRISVLVGSLLDGSRAKPGTVQVNVDLIDAESLLRSCVVEVVTAGKLKHTVEFDIEPALPALLVDPVLIHTVFQNLLNNAFTYTSPKGVIRLGLHKGNNTVDLTITDTGIGIPAQEQVFLFNKLFRASNAIVASAHGAGLGLYSVKRILDVLGGSISFTSKQGKGSIFFVTLPIAEVRNT